MDSPFLSVIIPMYNLRDYIEETVKSVMRQDGFKTDCELVIIDDGSTDGSYDVVKGYAESHDNITIERIENHGVSYARNLGVTLSKGKYIWFVDGDDLLVDGSIKSVIDFLKVSPCDKLHFPIRNFNDGDVVDNTHVNACFAGREGNLKDILKFSRLKGCFAGGVWSSVYKKSIIEKEDVRFNERIKYSEDVLFDYEYMTHCRSLAKTEVPLYLYRQRKTSVMHGKKHLEQAESFYLLAKEYERIGRKSDDKFIKKLSEDKKNLAVKAMVMALINNGDVALLKEKLKELSDKGLYPYKLSLKHVFNVKNAKQLYLNILALIYKHEFLAVKATKRKSKK